MNPSRPLTIEEIGVDLNFDGRPEIEIVFAQSAVHEWKHDFDLLWDWFQIANTRLMPLIWNGELDGDKLKGAIKWIEDLKTELQLASQNVTYWRNRLKSLSIQSPNGQTNPNTPQDWK